MVASGSKKHTCAYKTCKLPRNNNRYYWQVAYLIIGIGFLISNEEDFTFFPLFTFVTPILIDLFDGKAYGKIARFIRKTFIVLNMVVIIFCISGWYGLFADDKTSFVVSETAMLFSGARFPKTIILWVIIADIVVPIMYSQSMPTRSKALLPEIILGEPTLK